MAASRSASQHCLVAASCRSRSRRCGEPDGRLLYLGNYPFLDSARAYQQECGFCRSGSPVYRYLAQRHTGLLRSKWLTGEKSVLRQIARDFKDVDGYWWTCSKWYVLSWIPHPLVILAWKAKQRLAGRSSALPRLRNIRDSGLGVD